MKKVLVGIIFGSLLQSCSPTLLVNKEDLKRIPYGSTKVISKTDLSSEDSFLAISKVFAKNGCPVKSNRESMQVICGGKSVEGGTNMIALAYIEPNGTGSLITMTGEWGLDGMGQAAMVGFGGGGISKTTKIKWGGITSSKPCIAFQHLILMSLGIPDAQIRYEK